MIIWIVWLNTLAWSISKCEPPVNSYLPPSIGASTSPSSEYGPPGNQHVGSFNGRSQPGNDGVENQNEIPYSYSPQGQANPSSSLDTKYGPPNGQIRASRKNLQPQRGFSNNENPQYRNNRHGLGSRDHSSDRVEGLENLALTPDARQNSNFGQKPQTSYGPPPTGGSTQELSEFQIASNNNNRNLNGGFNDIGVQGQSGPHSYSSPEFGDNAEINSSFGDDGPADSANYEFSYEVDDSETGTKFGHSEKRQGDVATGEYNVDLPDGRKQVVEYEAGRQGYKPQIRYEGGNRDYSKNAPQRSGNGNQFQEQQNDFQQSTSQGFNDQERNQQIRGYPRGGPGSGNNFNEPSNGQQEFHVQANGYSSKGSVNKNGGSDGYHYNDPQGMSTPRQRSRNSENNSNSNGNGHNVHRGRDQNVQLDRETELSNGNMRNYPSKGTTNTQRTGSSGSGGDLQDRGYPGGSPQTSRTNNFAGYPRGGPNGAPGLHY